MQTLGAIDKIEFYNLNISALSNDCVIAPNTEGSSIANIEITSCTIENYRGIVRVRKVNGESSLKLILMTVLLETWVLKAQVTTMVLFKRMGL